MSLVKFIGSLWFTPEGAKVWGLNQLPSKVRYGALKLELTNNTAANLAAMSSPKSEFILGSQPCLVPEKKHVSSNFKDANFQ